MTLLEIIRKKKLVTVTDVTDVTVTPALKPSVTSVTPVTVTNQETNKVVFLEDAKFEERRQKVLKMLGKNPDSQRAIITDLESDPDNAILTIAIRDQYTFEMLVSKDKYDPFLMLELLTGGGTSH